MSDQLFRTTIAPLLDSYNTALHSDLGNKSYYLGSKSDLSLLPVPHIWQRFGRADDHSLESMYLIHHSTMLLFSPLWAWPTNIYMHNKQYAKTQLIEFR